MTDRPISAFDTIAGYGALLGWGPRTMVWVCRGIAASVVVACVPALALIALGREDSDGR